jgi:RNA polymerase sigma-70 factor (ECF subfamily)
MHEAGDPAEQVVNNPLSDEEVVQRVLAGDPALFEVLMRRYNQRLYRIARGILGSDAETEDVIQQAYVNAYFHLRQFENRARFSTWLTRIAVHEALARRRPTPVAVDDATAEAHFKAVQKRMAGLHSPAPDPEHQAFAEELRRLIETAVDALPESYRLVFILREIESLSTAETAECLEINVETVKTRLHRARALLRTALVARAGAATLEAFQFHEPRCDRVVADVFDVIKSMTAVNAELSAVSREGTRQGPVNLSRARLSRQR